MWNTRSFCAWRVSWPCRACRCPEQLPKQREPTFSQEGKPRRRASLHKVANIFVRFASLQEASVCPKIVSKDHFMTINWLRGAVACAVLALGIHVQVLAAQEYPVETRTLANGLKILVQPDHSIPNVTLYTFYRIGSR